MIQGFFERKIKKLHFFTITTDQEGMDQKKKPFKKPLVIGIILSDALVLGLVVGVHLRNTMEVRTFASVSEEKIQKEVKKGCEEWAESVLSGDRSNSNCRSVLSNSVRGGGKYEVKVNTKIRKVKDGIKVLVDGRVKGKSGILSKTEADFCSNCTFTKVLKGNPGLGDVLEQINTLVVDVTENAHSSASQVVEEKKAKNKQKREEERKARMEFTKAKNCQGAMEYGEFYEYDPNDPDDANEIVSCELGQLNLVAKAQGHKEAKDLYHKRIKSKLWKLTGKADYDFLYSSLDGIDNNPWNDFSVRHSAALIRDYMAWKDSYESLLSESEQRASRESFFRDFDKALMEFSDLEVRNSEKELFDKSVYRDLEIRRDGFVPPQAPSSVKPLDPTAPRDNNVKQKLQDLY